MTIGLKDSLHKLRAVFFASVPFLFIACGDDGSDGPPGDTGPTGPAPTAVSVNPTALVATISSVTIEGEPTVAFSVVDQDNLPYVDLTSVRFTLAKLKPVTGNDQLSDWQSYINRTEEVDGSVGSGTEDEIQATNDRDGTLVNNADGTYSYTFENDVTAITEPVAVSYESTLTHRLALQISGGSQPVVNATYDFRPDGGAIETTRDIVKTESCNSCHGNLAIHGGGRVEVKYCVTCHNPGTIDANSGNTVDFKVMVHKIHSGANLPSVVAGGDYIIWGFTDSEHDYSEVVYPQDIRNCTKCHDDSDTTNTPDSSNWQDAPSRAACGSCHDDVDFATGTGHVAGPQSNDDSCETCHSASGVVNAHVIGAEVAAQAFQYNLISVTNTSPGEFPTVTFSVTDPANADATYNLTTDPAFTTGSGVSRLAIDIAWDTRDYTNTGNGGGNASAVSLDPLGGGATAVGDGSYVITSGVAIPTDVTGSLAVAIEGHPAGDVDGDGTYSDRIPVTGVVSYYGITDSTAVLRRDVVDIDKCQACHNILSIHGSNRNGSVALCTLCHNPNNTDIAQRPADSATTSDGKVEESIDLKTMIHAIHAGDMRENDLFVYGFGNTEHDFSAVQIPGELENCETCHLEDAYTLPLADNVLGTSISTGVDVADPADDTKITAAAAVCSSCHDSALSQAHMEQQGGASFSTTQSAIDNAVVVETCEFCHGEGNAEDVKTVHGIE